ncbi:uncharacterized protein METZ01_LOCUS456950 [marine metagenome]|uniref:Uncharacterized protein n=1 Tax=marine metagenome TaxID=408172 RepID=A0A383A889_9ZZZZ
MTQPTQSSENGSAPVKVAVWYDYI